MGYVDHIADVRAQRPLPTPLLVLTAVVAAVSTYMKKGKQETFA